jgi:LDH2 family malate/lactate/ureidoglycolate dehydrogenase
MHALGVLCGGPASPARDGHLFIAFQPDLFMTLDDDRRALAAEIAALEATPRQDGVNEIRIPGERAHRERARLTRDGIEIDLRIHDALSRLAEAKSWTD